jgi:hypothetical protein
MSFGINLLEVNIYRLEEGVFYSQLICNKEGKNITIDARTSDAIALALRFKCPIYTSEEILQKSGIVIDIDETSKSKPVKQDIKDIEKNKTTGTDRSKYKDLDTKMLEELLEEAVKNEEYEKASIIQEELNKRKSI